MGFNSFSDSLLVLMEESLSKLKDLRLPTVQMFNVPESVSTNILMTLEPATIAMYLTYFDFETFQKIQVGVVGWRNAPHAAACTHSITQSRPADRVAQMRMEQAKSTILNLPRPRLYESHQPPVHVGRHMHSVVPNRRAPRCYSRKVHSRRRGTLLSLSLSLSALVLV